MLLYTGMLWDKLSFISRTYTYHIELYAWLHWITWIYTTKHVLLAATKQLYEWYFLSVCPSVRLLHLFDYVPIIASSCNFQEFLPMNKERSMQKINVKRSKVKVTEVTTQLNRFRTATPAWIHIWCWNDAYSFMLLRRGALLFFKVICQISKSRGSKNRLIWPRFGVSGLYLQVDY